MALQEKTFSYGSLQGESVSNAYMLDLTVREESTDQVNNTSLISYVLQIRSGPNNSFTEEISAAVTIGEVVVSRRVSICAALNTTYTLITGTQTVSHGENGELELAIQGDTWGVSHNQWAPPDMTVSGVMTLTPIPRESTVEATDGIIGEVSMIAVNRESADYSHSLRYSFGNLSGYIKADGSVSSEEVLLTATNISFQIPMDFYTQIPENKMGACYIFCQTYSGGILIGRSQKTYFTVKAHPNYCGPQIYGTVKDVNPVTVALTGNEEVLVRYQSRARCTVWCQGRNSASILSCTVNNKAIDQVLEFPRAEADTYVFEVLDSRAYKERCEVNVQMIPYIPLTCNAQVTRPEPTEDRILLQISKSNCFQGSFGAQDNTLSITYTSGDRSGTLTPVFQGHSYTAQIELSGFPYDQTGQVTLTVSDALMTLEIPLTVMKGIPVFDWSGTDVSFHVPVDAPNISCGAGFLPNYTDLTGLSEPGIWRIGDSYGITGLPELSNPAYLIVLSPYADGKTNGQKVCLQIVVNYSGSERKMRSIWYDLVYDWTDL